MMKMSSPSSPSVITGLPALTVWISLLSNTSFKSDETSPDPKSWSNWRSVAMRSIARLAAGTELCNFSAAVREISTQIESSPARIVAPRRRPEINPTSPKIKPVLIGTILVGSFASINTSTEPLAMENNDDPGSLRSKIVSPPR